VNLTGEVLLSYFESSADKHQKVFFQTEKDEPNFARLVKFFEKNGGEQMAERTIEKFMSQQRQPVVFLLDFVVVLGSLVEDVRTEEADREEFRKLVQQTKARMEGDSN
jgi:hypothetical protein